MSKTDDRDKRTLAVLTAVFLVCNKGLNMECAMRNAMCDPASAHISYEVRALVAGYFEKEVI